MKDTVKISQSCPTLFDPMDYTGHGILQARILEWVAYPFSRGSFWRRNKPGSPALQVDSLATELSVKPIQVNKYLLGIWIMGMKCNRYLSALKTQS